MAHDVPRRPSRPKDRPSASGASNAPSHPRELLPRRIRAPGAEADNETTERDLVVGDLLVDSPDQALLGRQADLDEYCADDDSPTVVRGPRNAAGRPETEAPPKRTLEPKRQPVRNPVGQASPAPPQPSGLGRARVPVVPPVEAKPRAASTGQTLETRRVPVAPGTQERMRGTEKPMASRVRPPAGDDEPTVLWTQATRQRDAVPAAEPRRTPEPKRKPTQGPVADTQAAKLQPPGLDRTRVPAVKPTETAPRAASTPQAAGVRREAVTTGSADRVRRVPDQPVARLRSIARDDDEPTVVWTPGTDDRGALSEAAPERAPAPDRSRGRTVFRQASPEMPAPSLERSRLLSAPPAQPASHQVAKAASDPSCGAPPSIPPPQTASHQAATERTVGPRPEPDPPESPARGREGARPAASRVCPMCNAENASDLVFCYTCGRRLVEAEPADAPRDESDEMESKGGLGMRVRSWIRGKVRKHDPE